MEKNQKKKGERERYASLALSITPDEAFSSYTQLADAAGWLGDVSRQKQYAIKALNNGESDAISYMASHNIVPNDDTEPKRLYEYADYIRQHAHEVGDKSAIGLVYIINRRKRGMLLRKSKWAIYVYKVMVKK